MDEKASLKVSTSKPTAGLTFDSAVKKFKAGLKKDRDTCILIAGIRSKMESKPKETAPYIMAFKQSLQHSSGMSRKKIEDYLNTAAKLDAMNPNKDKGNVVSLAVCKQPIPKTPWKGKWSDVDCMWVGEGQYAGTPKPQDHAPKWWQGNRYLSGDRYCATLSKVNTFNQLCRELWFMVDDGNPKKLKKEIKMMHKDLNAWCSRNGMAELPLPPNRTSFLTKKQTAKHIEAGIIRKL